jgi:hypothetical protein
MAGHAITVQLELKVEALSQTLYLSLTRSFVIVASVKFKSVDIVLLV